jgi:hypothetical protein
MSLYGRTDSNANKNKVELTRGNGPASASGDMTVVFVDEQEAALAENKARGINGPGWWNFHTYSQGGVTRTKAECLAFITGPDTNANETQADDAIAADYTIVIDSQPAAASVTAPAAAQFVVAASTTPAGGTLTFQWQEDSGAGFGDITDGGIYSGATTNTLDLSDSTGLDTYQYRVVVSNTGASASVTSDAATLTVA